MDDDYEIDGCAFGEHDYVHYEDPDGDYYACDVCGDETDEA